MPEISLEDSELWQVFDLVWVPQGKIDSDLWVRLGPRRRPCLRGCQIGGPGHELTFFVWVKLDILPVSYVRFGISGKAFTCTWNTVDYRTQPSSWIRVEASRLVGIIGHTELHVKS
jgi:hypothetical protein